jgi:hypothetical protein
LVNIPSRTGTPLANLPGGTEKLSQNGASMMRDQHKPLEVSRSLTLLATGGDENRRSPKSVARFGMRPQVAFLSQLLAIRHGAPEYRARRRAEPAAAIAAYRAGQGRVDTAHNSGIAA